MKMAELLPLKVHQFILMRTKLCVHLSTLGHQLPFASYGVLVQLHVFIVYFFHHFTKRNNFRDVLFASLPDKALPN